MTLRRNLLLAAYAAAVLTATLAKADIFVTATERENQKLVKVDLTPPYTPASVTTIFNTKDVPDSLVLDQQQRLIYSLPNSNEIRRVNPDGTSDILVADATVGINNPQDMILGPNGNFLLVSDYLGNRIIKVDLTMAFPNGTTFATITHPNGLVFDSAGRLFVNAGFDTMTAGIFELNPANGMIINSSMPFDPANEPDGLAFDPSNPGKLFATSSGTINGSNAIYVIDENTLLAVKIATVPEPDGIISDFHGTLYIASRSGFVYSVVEATGATTQLTPVPTIDDMGIVPAQAPTATKAFNPNMVTMGSTSVITIAITNPNPAAISLNGVNFTDPLPAGVVVAAAPNGGGTCVGTFNPALVGGATSVSFALTNPLPPGSCTVTFTVQDNNVAPTTSMNCVTVNSLNGGSAAPACDNITDMTVPINPVGPGVTKSFGAQSIQQGNSVSMTITLSNPNAFVMSLINFTDTLPAGLQVAGTIGLTDTCGGAFNPVLAAGATVLTYSGGSIAAQPLGMPPLTCSITLNVTGVTSAAASSPVPGSCPAGTTPTVGQKINCVIANSIITDAQGAPHPVTGGPGIGILAVVSPLPPVLIKSFAVPSVALSGTTTLTFLVSNPNTMPSLSVSGIAFTDTLPAGLIIATPANLTPPGGCGTTMATAGTNVILLSNLTLPGGGSCIFSVDVTATLAGAQVNITSPLTSTTPGVPPGTPATATLNVDAPDDAYQINYLPNVKVGGTVDISNAGSLGADPFGPLSGTTGRLCANVYTFSPDEQEISCCSCLVTPNGLVHISASGLIGNTATGVQPDSVVVKLLFTIPLLADGTGGTQVGPFTGSSCNAASPFGLANLAPGGRAWATKLHSPTTPPTTFGLTETEFWYNPIHPGDITANTIGELKKLTSLCQFIAGNQSGAGICSGCALGGLGAAKQ